MKKICLCLQIHQPYRLCRYRFFDIGGNTHYYTDDEQNREVFQRVAQQSYLPAGRMLLELLRQYPDFRLSLSISGLALEQMELYGQEVLDTIRELVATGRVELLAETYAHSLTSLYDLEEWRAQITMQQNKLRELFGTAPSRVLCNTELIYSDEIATEAQAMGFEGVLTEGARHILGWKSPGYVYGSSSERPIKMLLRNVPMTELISRDFSRYDSPDYPVTADKLLNRVKWLPEGEDFCVLYMNYETLGSLHRAESGIFDFFRALPALAERYEVGFATPSQLIDTHKIVGQISVPTPISGSGEERGTNDWMGNILQQGALDKLRIWGERVRTIQDNVILQDWLYLQSADHFYYMNTSGSGKGFSPYSSAYDAFNNYMNVLSDFLLRVEAQAPLGIEVEELNSYQKTIKNQNRRIASLEAEVAELRQKLETLQGSKPAGVAASKSPGKRPSKAKARPDSATEPK